ncbi:MAG: 3-hydroxybutyrate dehydrogenase [Flavobacteriaceae bacterium]|nr:3-hydroxybutyrate dehydrogenase [Flavobacteriaceae bacterium]
MKKNNEKMGIKGQVAIITGSASGIGKAIAERYAMGGAKVVIADFNLEIATAVAEEIKATGAEAMAIRMDVSSEKEVNAGVEAVVKAYGGIDILVANAGIQIVHPIGEFSLEDWHKVLGVNLDGAFITARACMKHMYLAKRGSIIFTGSVHSKAASPLKSAYVAAKHGVLGLARTIAKEGLSHGVRSNVICPGLVMTPLIEMQIPVQAKMLGISEDDVKNKVLRMADTEGMVATLEDVAEVAYFFAAMPTNCLTGQSIDVNYGLLCS